MTYWSSPAHVSLYVWITIFIIFPFFANYFTVRTLGEAEYILTSLKITAFLGITVLGFIIVGGGTDALPLLATNNNTQPIFCGLNQSNCLSPPGFRCKHLPNFISFSDWKQSAFMPEGPSDKSGKALAFWDCCSLAIYSYTGTELLAITAYETQYQRRDIPIAVKRVSRRLILYYTIAILVLGLTVAPDDPMLALPNEGHPHYPGGFIVMAERAGLPAVASIINGVMILASLTVATGDIYVVVLLIPCSL